MIAYIKVKMITAFIFVLYTANCYAQKVANYAIGKFGTDNYEHFSFGTDAGKGARITYAYGKNNKELNATYIGKGTYQGKPCFKLALGKQQLFYVVPLAAKLHVVGKQKAYNKFFAWEYEGPVNGVGTYCSTCAQDEKEAMNLLKRYYIK